MIAKARYSKNKQNIHLIIRPRSLNIHEGFSSGIATNLKLLTPHGHALSHVVSADFQVFFDCYVDDSQSTLQYSGLTLSGYQPLARDG